MDIKTLMGVRARAARDAVGLSQSAAAERLDVARQTLARMEKGEVSFSGEQLAVMANLYGRPVTYFYDLREGGRASIAFRADKPQDVDPRLKQRLLDQLAAIADLETAAGRSVMHGLPTAEHLTQLSPENAKLSSREIGIVRSVAQKERGRLGLGDRAPVSDPVALLESIDIRVIPFNLPTEENLVSGFSAFSESLGAGIFVNTHPSLSFEHQIFSVLHEYAHLIFHRKVYRDPNEPYRTRGSHASPDEKTAHIFAGEFLVPYAALQQHAAPLTRISPTDIMRLKRMFRVSFISMLTQLSQGGYLTPADKQRLWSLCTRRNWNIQEPEPIREPPAYGCRTATLARMAWERGEASLSFIGEVLNKDRKAIRDLVTEWEKEQDVQADAIH